MGKNQSRIIGYIITFVYLIQVLKSDKVSSIDSNSVLATHDIQTDIKSNEFDIKQQQKILLTKMNHNMLISLLKNKTQLSIPFESIRVLKERLKRVVVNKHETQSLYILYMISDNDKITYICKGYELSKEPSYKVTQILDYNNDDRHKAMEACNFSDAFNHTESQKSKNAKDKDLIYNNQETYETADGILQKKEKLRETTYTDDNSSMWKKEHSSTVKDSSNTKNGWSNNTSVTRNSSYSSSNANSGTNFISTELGGHQRPKLDGNFDFRTFGSFKNFN